MVHDESGHIGGCRKRFDSRRIFKKRVAAYSGFEKACYN